MSSPLKVFRKNKKVFMAAATILAMVAFVFIGPWSDFQGSAAQRENQEVFTWKYGTVRQSDLDKRILARQIINQFANSTRVLGAQLPANFQIYSTENVNEIVASMLFAKLAEEYGIVVSDDVVDQSLRSIVSQLIRQQATDADLAALFSRMASSGWRVTESQLFDALRFEIAAEHGALALMRPMERMSPRNQFFIQFAGDPPAKRWEYFLQLNQKAKAQVLPVAVEKFLPEVAEPTGEQLQKFYDEYRNVFANPDSPTPGFRVPEKAKFQYFKVESEKLIEEAKKKVTQEEIAKYYEEFKDRDFRKARLSETTKPEDKPETETKPETTAPAGDAGTKAEEKPAEQAEKNDAKTEPKADSKTEPKTTDSKNSDAPPANQGSEVQGRESGVKGQLVSYTNVRLAQADTKKAAEPAGEKKADADKKSEPAADATKTPDDKKGDEAKNGAADAKIGDAKSDDAKKDEPKTGTGTQPPLPVVEYEPLEKVADEIRQKLALEKMQKQVDEAFGKLYDELANYQHLYDAYQVGNRKVAPEPLDLPGLAKPYPFVQPMETGLISMQQAYDDTDLGRSTITLRTFQSVPFLQVAFGRNVLDYVPQRSTDAENNQYLWWRAELQKSRTPPLDEIKDEVTLAWKMIEARKLALAKAEDYAAQVRPLKKPMKEALAGTVGSEVLSIGPFSWMSRNEQNQFAEPMITTIPEVKSAGPEFMEAVFSLQPLEVSVASNHPKTVYYVIQVEQLEPSLEELHKQFMTDMGSPILWRNYAQIGAREHQNQGIGLREQVQNHFHFKANPSYKPPRSLDDDDI